MKVQGTPHMDITLSKCLPIVKLVVIKGESETLVDSVGPESLP
jgi:hypothetical protein